MVIDLEDKITRFVVQEYLNKIVAAETSPEKSYDIHKLIHTLDVVKMAHRLIEKSDENLSSEIKMQILNAAMLHDVARCYEYQDGKKVKGLDHGLMGSRIILHHFPDLVVEQGATKWHNKLPSVDDPQEIKVVLDYVRDADMMANIDYQVKHMDLFLGHIRGCFPKEDDESHFSSDIMIGIRERAIKPYGKDQKHTLLDMFVNQLLWIFALKTKVALKIAKEENLFVRYRDVIRQQVVPILNISKADQQALDQEILEAFPKELFEGEFQRHGM